MKRKFLGLLVVTALLASMLTSFIPTNEASAGPPEWAPAGQKEQLEKGWQRDNPHSKSHKIGEETVDGIDYAIITQSNSSVEN